MYSIYLYYIGCKMLMSPCFRTSLDTVAVLDTRDCALVPAHGLLLSAAHSLASNHRGQLSSLVSQAGGGNILMT